MTSFVPIGYYPTILTSADSLEMDHWFDVTEREENSFQVEIVPQVKYLQGGQGGHTNSSMASDVQCSRHIYWISAWMGGRHTWKVIDLTGFQFNSLIKYTLW